MKNKNILILGSSGNIGRSLTKKLLSDGYYLTAPLRNHDRAKRNILSGDIGQIKVIKFDISNISAIEQEIQKSDIIVNLLGILFENSNCSFELAHYLTPKILSNLTIKHNKRLIHVSSLGSSLSSKSSYLYSKALGEHHIVSNHNNYTIIKPSIVFGEEDKFLNNFAQMTKFLPFLPLYKRGKTKFQPIYIDDLALFLKVIIETENTYKNKIFDAVGPNSYSFKEILEIIYEILKKKKRFINIPDLLGAIQGRVMGLLPKPPFTYDQFISLDYDSVSPGSEKIVASAIGRELSSMKLIASIYLNKFIEKI
ncbi:MAG: hypothetical protein CMI90_05930 [Pelagibacteraceae bacterium]|nr:hypothetical protein [Pelagibacteraceae bacterium]|tara:strand:- start:99 stop:1028 length:930 start_codon:yes stop_codon:yes gene_type:complete